MRPYARHFYSSPLPRLLPRNAKGGVDRVFAVPRDPLAVLVKESIAGGVELPALRLRNRAEADIVLLRSGPDQEEGMESLVRGEVEVDLDIAIEDRCELRPPLNDLDIWHAVAALFQFRQALPAVFREIAENDIHVV